MKEKKELKIVYMGTPDFAVEPLRRLVEGGYHIVGVITMPDKPAGRGHKLQFSAVKKYALECALPILQPTKLKEESFIEALRTWQADLQIVVAFRMLPEVVWNMPPMGTFNLHASLLPQYRGAAPINWAVINGDKETGITTFFLEHQIDTGNIIQQEKIAIEETDDVGIVHDKLMNLGAELVLKTVDALLAGTVKAI
ncbi:MAG: methionyl-tRNA formyltransferase, partial [Bacteroidaceae bacterium]